MSMYKLDRHILIMIFIYYNSFIENILLYHREYIFLQNLVSDLMWN
jgi:hypothetical protein